MTNDKLMINIYFRIKVKPEAKEQCSLKSGGCDTPVRIFYCKKKNVLFVRSSTRYKELLVQSQIL